MKRYSLWAVRQRVIYPFVTLAVLITMLGLFAQPAEAAITRFSGRVFTGPWKTLFVAHATGQRDAGNQVRVRMEIIPSDIYLKAVDCRTNRDFTGSPVLIKKGDTRGLYTLAPRISRGTCFKLVGKRANGILGGWADIRGRVSY